MPTANIIFPPSSAPGTAPQEGGGRLINAFGEEAPVGAPSKIIHRRSPGLERMTFTTPYFHTRGFLDVGGGEALWVLNDRIQKVNSSFAITDLGPLLGTEPVTFGRNNAGPPNNVVVTGTGCFNVTSTGAPTSFADPDLPGSPTSVCDYHGYLVWSFADGRIFASDLNALTVSALSFNTEQGLNARRVVQFAGRLYVFGDKWTAVYNDVGGVPFPFSREVVIPRGIVGTSAVAGWESGWANQLLWVGDDFVVYRLDGYTPVPISTNDVSRAIQATVLEGKRNLIEAFVYMYDKNAFWVLSAHDDWTWEYNLTTQSWNERMSYNLTTWKGMKSIRVFDRWLIGDQYTGELYQTSGTVFLDGLDPLIWQIESGTLHNFPRGTVVSRASFHISSAVGDLSIVPNPKVEISWSLDGGFSFGNPVIRKMGGPGMSLSHPYVLNCGLSRGQGLRFRLRVSDPVHVGLNGGVAEAEVRSFSG